jgi:hypothetical protein
MFAMRREEAKGRVNCSGSHVTHCGPVPPSRQPPARSMATGHEEEAGGAVHGPIPPPPPPVGDALGASGPSGALFWDADEVIDPDDPDMAALLALQEETPPEERAAAFKVGCLCFFLRRR